MAHQHTELFNVTYYLKNDITTEKLGATSLSDKSLQNI
jgi:hypothetical protein